MSNFHTERYRQCSVEHSFGTTTAHPASVLLSVSSKENPQEMIGFEVSANAHCDERGKGTVSRGAERHVKKSVNAPLTYEKLGYQVSYMYGGYQLFF